MAGRILYYHCGNESRSEDDKRKMKRKDDGEELPRVIIDDFSDLSLISPPVKIRRLDVEFPPTQTVQFKHEDGDQDQLPRLQVREDAVAAGGELYMDEMEATEAQVAVDASENVNDERALILYRPVHHLHSHPYPNPGTCNISFSVPSHLIPSLTVRDEIVHNEKERLAVVPWAPNKFNWNQSHEQEVELCNDKSMEMEVEMEEQQLQQYEEERAQMILNANANEGSLFADSSCHQRQNQNQKHCLAPQFPLHSAAPATPVTWSW